MSLCVPSHLPAYAGAPGLSNLTDGDIHSSYNARDKSCVPWTI